MNLKNFKPPWIINQKWTRRFFLSHIFGWITATVQTVWIVYEVRAAAKKLLNGQRRKNEKNN